MNNGFAVRRKALTKIVQDRYHVKKINGLAFTSITLVTLDYRELGALYGAQEKSF